MPTSARDDLGIVPYIGKTDPKKEGYIYAYFGY